MVILVLVCNLDQFKVFGLVILVGVFFVGLFGCGKILLVKVVVNEFGLNFIFVKGFELLNMYVGESECVV